MRPPFRTRSHELRLDATELVGPCILTPTSVWAVYRMAPQRWSFLTADKRASMLNLNAKRWASLAGRAVKLRVSAQPYAATQWADQLGDITPHPLPDVAGALGYDDYLHACNAGRVEPLSHMGWLVGQQRRVRQARLDSKMVVLMVRVSDRPKGLTGRRLHDALIDPSSAPRGTGPVMAAIAEVAQQVSGEGFAATPIDPTELEWLMYRSCAPGLPVPARLGVGGPRWETQDMSALIETVRWTFPPFGNVVKVEALRDGHHHVGYATVLTVQRMESIRYPESGRSPWMTYTDRLDFPVEWSLSGTIRSGREMQKEAQFILDRSRHVRGNYHEFGEQPPHAVARAVDDAARIVDEVNEGNPDVAARFQGPIRMAVTGETVEQTIERARTVQTLMADSLNMMVDLPSAQAVTLAEFVPAQRWRQYGYTQTMPVRYLAAAVPHTSSVIGDGRGPYLGASAGTGRHAFMLDSNYAPEAQRRSGLCPIIGDQGAGKSFLTGLMAYQEARRGIQTVILDPSGPLARLCLLPELAPYAAHQSLTTGEPGSLSPPALIVDPSREDFKTNAKFVEALRNVAQERKQITIDTLRGLIPPSHQAAADVLLPRAVRGLDIVPTTGMWEIVKRLEALGEDGVELAAIIRDIAEIPAGALIMGEPDQAPHVPDLDRALTVMSLAGISHPDTGLPESQWTMQMRLAQPLLSLAIVRASRFVWTGSPNKRRALHLDEVHFLRRWGSGKAFFERLSRDSRKRNAAVFASSQVPADIIELGVASMFTHAFVGRIEDDEIAREALRFVRAPEEYAERVTGLSRGTKGEFLYRDVFGRVARVVIDGDWVPTVLGALDTNPDGTTAADYGGAH